MEFRQLLEKMDPESSAQFSQESNLLDKAFIEHSQNNEDSENGDLRLDLVFSQVVLD